LKFKIFNVSSGCIINLTNTIVKTEIILYNIYMIKLPTTQTILLKTETLVIVFFAIISTMVAGFFTIYIRVPVNGLSMFPTLNSNLEQTGQRDIVYINRFSKIRRGDVVVVDATDTSMFGGYIIKRLIAVGGDTVNIISNHDEQRYDLQVNGVIVDSREYSAGHNTWRSFSSYLQNVDSSKKNSQGLIIGDNEVFVLGDNWNKSKDSSLIGAFKAKDVVGKIDFIIQPSDNEFVRILKEIF
jgi:signal peptidase I